MAENKTITELVYPYRGLDLQTAFGGQRALTTPCCKNCLGHEPCTGRKRGGRRPGLGRLNGIIPAGATTIQHLNQIVIGSTAGLFDPDYPWDDTDEIPGFPPLPPGLITTGWDDEPITGDDGPYPGEGGGGLPLPGKKKRKKGSGIQPNPNQLVYAPPAVGTTRLFQASGQVLITVHTAPVDFFGTQPTFEACMCIDPLYLWLAGPPTDARHFNGWWCQKAYYFNLHNIPQNGYSMVGSVITGSTVGPTSNWGVRACNGGGAFDFPCISGYSVLDNVGALGLDLCCTLLSLVPREVGFPMPPGSAGLEPGQDEGACKTEGDV